MRATIMHAAGDLRIENVPDPTITEATAMRSVPCRKHPVAADIKSRSQIHANT